MKPNSNIPKNDKIRVLEMLTWSDQSIDTPQLQASMTDINTKIKGS